MLPSTGESTNVAFPSSRVASRAIAAGPTVDISSHVAFSPMTAYYALGARLHDMAPVVLTFYAWWPEIGRPGGTVTRRAVEAADWVIACSEATLGEVCQVFRQVFGEYRDPAHV